MHDFPSLQFGLSSQKMVESVYVEPMAPLTVAGNLLMSKLKKIIENQRTSGKRSNNNTRMIDSLMIRCITRSIHGNTLCVCVCVCAYNRNFYICVWNLLESAAVCNLRLQAPDIAANGISVEWHIVRVQDGKAAAPEKRTQTQNGTVALHMGSNMI